MDRKDVEKLIERSKASAARRGKALPEDAATPINLAGMDLKNADLSGLNLFGSNLWKANLKGANLNGTNLRRCNLAGAVLDDVKTDPGTSFEEANLAGAKFKGCPISLLELADDFEVRKGLRQAFIDKASNKTKAAKDWGGLPVERRYDVRTFVSGKDKHIVGRRLSGANLKGLKI